jgi:hypothetical protein
MRNSNATDRIRELSNKAITCNDAEELKRISSDLRDALHEHLQHLKANAAEPAARAQVARK